MVSLHEINWSETSHDRYQDIDHSRFKSFHNDTPIRLMIWTLRYELRYQDTKNRQNSIEPDLVYNPVDW